MQVLHELRKLGQQLPAKAPPIPVAFDSIGTVGHVEHRRGIYLNSATARLTRALLRDNYKAERLAKDLTNGRATAAELLELARLGSDRRDAIRAIKSMSMAISSWDNVVSARSSGKSWDFLGTKASPTTVANQWHSNMQGAGNPGAVTFGTGSGVAALDSNTVGAWPLPMSLGAAENLYLTNMGVNHATGTNVVLAVDVIIGAGGILTSIVTSQTINTTALPRWTGGAGLQMTLQVVTTPGTATGIPNVTINYTNQANTAAQSTGAVSIGATSAIAGRLLPIQDGPMVRFASGDYGVRSIQQVTFSASSAGAAGAVAALIYKPLLIVPTLSTTTWVERSTPAQIGGIRQLTEVVQGSKPCIQFFVLPSTTSTGIQNYLIETVYG